MHTEDFVDVLRNQGFGKISYQPEPTEPFNTMLVCHKVEKSIHYADLVLEKFKATKIKEEKCRK